MGTIARAIRRTARSRRTRNATADPHAGNQRQQRSGSPRRARRRTDERSRPFRRASTRERGHGEHVCRGDELPHVAIVGRAYESHLGRSRKRRSWVTRGRTVVACKCRLEPSILRGRWLVGSPGIRQLTPGRGSASPARVRSPREEAVSRSTSSAPSANYHGVCGRQSRRGPPARSPTACPRTGRVPDQLANTVPVPMRRCPRAARTPVSARMRVVLPEPFGPTIARRSP